MKRPLDSAIVARRDELKAALGDRYQEAVEPYMQIIAGLGGDDAKAALALYQQIDEQGGAPTLALAALVELRERE